MTEPTRERTLATVVGALHRAHGCSRCQVAWCGDPVCWSCGQPATMDKPWWRKRVSAPRTHGDVALADVGGQGVDVDHIDVVEAQGDSQ